MFEEPFRFVEAIANRREYIESQLAGGSPIVSLDYLGGVLLFTLSRERQKIFEVYDRIAMGAIGHPGDIERLRMTAIELASTEGFTRSSSDVSLRRMANYSLSPALKAAFEQVYGAPYLARLLFVELGERPGESTFLRVEYDGSIHSNGTPRVRSRQPYAVIAGTKAATEQMERALAKNYRPDLDLTGALRLAFDVWSAGQLSANEEVVPDELPEPAALRTHQRGQLDQAAIEAAVLAHGLRAPVTYRALGEAELAALTRSVAD